MKVKLKGQKIIALLTVAVMTFVLLQQLIFTNTVRADVTEYSLWVGNTRVTSDNKDNIPGVQGGTMSYNPDTNTLTMNNVTGVDENYLSASACYMFIYGEMDLSIELIGNNSWINTNTTHKALTGIELGNHDLTITGSGELEIDVTVDNTETFLKACAISCNKLTMNGGTLVCKATHSTNNLQGVGLNIYNLDMNGGTIITAGSRCAIRYVNESRDLTFSENFGPLIEASYNSDGSASTVVTAKEMLAVGYANWSDSTKPAFKYIKISNDQSLYNVTVSNDGNGKGTASPSSALIGSTVTVQATPTEGYSFKEWKVISGGIELDDPSSSSTTFELRNADAEIQATFEVIPVNTYSVDVTIDTIDKDSNPTTSVGGTATVSKDSGVTGDKITVTATPNEGYEVDSIKYGDGRTFKDITTTKEFDIEDYDVIVDVTYKAIDTSSSGGSTTDPATGSSTTTDPATGTSITTDPATSTSGSSTTTDPATGSSTTTDPATGTSITTDPATSTSGSSTTTDPATGSSTTTDPATGTTSGSTTDSATSTSSDATMDPTAPTYTVIKGADATSDGTTDIVIEIKRSEDDEHCLSYFEWVAVDGTKLTNEQAPTSSGSTIVTIKSDYLKTLSEGKHTVVVNFVDNSVSTTITIQAAAQKSGSNIPATGELQSPTMYLGIALIVAACGVTSIVVMKKRKEET